MSISITLYDYTGSNLFDFINTRRDTLDVIQVLPISEFRFNERTGVDSRDYLIIYNKTDTDNP